MNNNNSSPIHVFLTGATGTMGLATLRTLTASDHDFRITLLARRSWRNRRILRPWRRDPRVSIVWGDLRNADDVKKGVEGADFVLHIGGSVSPKADYNPQQTLITNIKAMHNIIDAVKARPDADKVGVVYIGSVAQYGPCNAPMHWGRAGDPLQPARMDAYALSKVIAERTLAESGLRKWVSLRQTGILSEALLYNGTDPIAFHVPVNGVLEWATVEDSARLMHQVCMPWVPDSFWRRFYNIGGGEEYRLSNYEFESKLMKTLHCPPPEKIFDARWFATDNFHGMWYEDSDDLEEILHFRHNVPVDEYFARMSARLPAYFRLAKICPAFLIKWGMRWVAGRNHLAPLYWRRHQKDATCRERIEAHFGGIEAWNAAPNWDELDLTPPSKIPMRRYHGYDESKPESELDMRDMDKVAEFHGGRCLSLFMTPGDLYTPLRWVDAEGNEFPASPATVLFGGHWTPMEF